MKFTPRKTLPHIPPPSVSHRLSGAKFFITVNVDRAHYGVPISEIGRMGPLVGQQVAVEILCTLQHYRTLGQIYPSIAVVMPDHLHFIVQFSEDVVMMDFISKFKRWIASRCGVHWQDGFFDHRLRNDAEFAEKYQYVLQNPVRKGLCATSEEWPFLMRWS